MILVPLVLAVASLSPSRPANSMSAQLGTLETEAKDANDVPFAERMAGYEGRRLTLDHAFDKALDPFASAAAAALLAEVRADSEVPGWYTGEIAALAESYAFVEALEAEAREEALAALRSLPDWSLPTDEASEALTGAIERLAEIFGPHHPVVSQRYFFLSNLSAQAGRWDESVRCAEAALEAAEGLEGERGAQTALRRMWLGSIYRRINRIDEAEAAMQGARATLDRLRTSELGVWRAPRCHVDNYLGLLYMELDRYEEAKLLLTNYVHSSAEVFGPRSSAHIAGLNNLGLLYDSMMLYEQSAAIQARSVELAESVIPEGNPHLARHLFNLGVAEHQAGRLEAAKEHLEQAIAIIEPQELMRDVGVHARLMRSQIALLEGDSDEAVKWAEAAMADEAAVGSVVPRERARVYLVLISAMSNAGHWDRARSFMEAYVATGNDVSPLRTEYYRIILDARTSEDPEIRRRFEAVIAGLDAEEDAGTTWRSAPRISYAGHLRDQGALEEAKEQLLEAAAIFEESRGLRAEGFGRSAFRASPQPQLALVEFELGRHGTALEVLEAWRGRSLHDLIESSRDGRRASLRSALASAERSFAALGEGPRPEPIDEGVAGQVRLALEEKLDFLRGELALGLSAVHSEPASISELQAALAPGEAYLGWTLLEFHGDQALIAWVLGPDGPPNMVRIDDGAAVVDRMRAFAKGLGVEAQSVFEPDPRSMHGEARALGDVLFGLVEGGEAALEHLMLIPGELDGLPFEALRPGGEWAGERWTLSYAPSATLHALLRSRKTGAPFHGSALCVGDPLLREVLGPGEAERGETTAVLRSGTDISKLPAVPASGEEAKAVAAMYPRSVILTGRRARELALSAVGTEHSVIHIASHALVGGSDPHGTGIVLAQVDLPDPYEQALAGKRPLDGFLSVPEIASEWRIDADLVTLSACRSALGPAVRGEGYVGLSSALFQAGAGAVLASLWDVQDEPTRVFMEAFYREWRDLAKEGGTVRAKATALGRARAYLRAFEVDGRRPYAHPAFWSAFVLMGNPD